MLGQQQEAAEEGRLERCRWHEEAGLAEVWRAGQRPWRAEEDAGQQGAASL